MIENKTTENKKELEIPVEVVQEERFMCEGKYEVVSDELLEEVSDRILKRNIKAFRELAK